MHTLLMGHDTIVKCSYNFVKQFKRQCFCKSINQLIYSAYNLALDTICLFQVKSFQELFHIFGFRIEVPPLPCLICVLRKKVSSSIMLISNSSLIFQKIPCTQTQLIDPKVISSTYIWIISKIIIVSSCRQGSVNFFIVMLLSNKNLLNVSYRAQ